MQLYRTLLLNYALHNGDAHLKNFALIYSSPDDAVMAPVYDVVTTSAYPDMDDMPALTLAGKKAWWMGKALRQFAANSLSLTQKELDVAECAIVQAINQTLSLLAQMIERYPFFRDTGKRMLIEWDDGKLDIGKDEKKRLNRKTGVLEEMKLSDVKPKMKKENPYADQNNSLHMKKMPRI